MPPRPAFHRLPRLLISIGSLFLLYLLLTVFMDLHPIPVSISLGILTALFLMVRLPPHRHRLCKDSGKPEWLQRFRNDHETYRHFFDSAPFAMLSVDSWGTITLANRNALSQFGFRSRGSIIGKSIFELTTGDITNPIQQALTEEIPETEKYRIVETTCTNGKGGHFTAEVHIVRFDTASRPPAYFLFLHDISSKKTAELEKQQLEEQFRAIYKMEAIGQLAGGIAHDYNNILGAISGYADLIQHLYTDDERLEKYTRMILSAARRASELTKKLLTFARRRKLNMTEFDASKALREVISLLGHTLDKTITVSHQELTTEAYIHGDVIEFQNAIMNLALNARDAMPKGGQLTVKSGITDIDQTFISESTFTLSPGKHFIIDISDSGSGMDQNTQNHLFEPFFTTKDTGQGTGLGLASVYGTVKSHNGAIEVKTEVGSGTTFTLYFPLVATPEHIEDEQSAAPVTGKGRLLLVDDEHFLRNALSEMLSWLGYSVTSCEDAPEALSLFSENPGTYDLVILDMKMPGMSGPECYREMKKIKPDVIALISTGLNLEEEHQHLLDEGIKGIIQKPYVSAQLSRAVHAALHSTE